MRQILAIRKERFRNAELLLIRLSLSSVLFCGYLRAQEPPSTVVDITLSSGHCVEGELLRVRDTAIVISVDTPVQPSDSLKGLLNIVVIPNSRIHKLVIPGRSDLLKGMGFGFFIGAGVGACIGTLPRPGQDFYSFDTKEGNMMAGGVLGGGLGLLIGTLAGASSSTHDEVIKPDARHGYLSLGRRGRYPLYEPPELKRVKGDSIK